jgi:hypothetical protein
MTEIQIRRPQEVLLTPYLRLNVQWANRFIDTFNKMYPSRWPDEPLPEDAPARDELWEIKYQLLLLVKRFFDRTGALPALGDTLLLPAVSEYISLDFQVDQRIISEQEEEPDILDVIYYVGSNDFIEQFGYLKRE